MVVELGDSEEGRGPEVRLSGCAAVRWAGKGPTSSGQIGASKTSTSRGRDATVLPKLPTPPGPRYSPTPA